jgi:hypothetical protein
MIFAKTRIALNISNGLLIWDRLARVANWLGKAMILLNILTIACFWMKYKNTSLNKRTPMPRLDRERQTETTTEKGHTMKRIYKYPLKLGSNVIATPKFTKILTVQSQNDELYVWCIVDPYQDEDEVTIDVVYTGHEVPTRNYEPLKYIATVQIGLLVYHAFTREVYL